MNKRICKYYQHPKICTYKDVCGEKLITPNAVHCCSNLYYSMGSEQECEKLTEIINKSAKNFCNDYFDVFEENQKLKDELQNIQHNCTREGCRYYEDNTYKVFYNCKAKIELSNYKQALDEIKRKCLKYQTCRIILKEDILDIINKAKDGE